MTLKNGYMDKKNVARKIAGGNSSLGRSALDFYPTPPYATASLMEREIFEGDIWEPACGRGDISEVLIEYGYKVKSSDIGNYGYGETGKNFLNTEGLFSDKYEMVDNIITNPPFNLALEFVEQSKKYANRKVAMFLKTAFLEGNKRYAMFQDHEFPLKTLYQFSKRVNFGIHAGTHKNGGMIPFAWFVWERGYKGNPTIKWIE